MNIFYIIVSTIHLVLMLMASFVITGPVTFAFVDALNKRYYNALHLKNILGYVFLRSTAFRLDVQSCEIKTF